MQPNFNVNLDEVRFLQEFSTTSGADALFVSLATVPGRRIWIVLAASVTISANDIARDWWFSKVTRAGNVIGLERPLNMAVLTDADTPKPTLSRVYVLYPSEVLRAGRSVALAASTITLRAQILELGVPGLRAAGIPPLTPPVADEPPSPGFGPAPELIGGRITFRGE